MIIEDHVHPENTGFRFCHTDLTVSCCISELSFSLEAAEILREYIILSKLNYSVILSLTRIVIVPEKSISISYISLLLVFSKLNIK